MNINEKKLLEAKLKDFLTNRNYIINYDLNLIPNNNESISLALKTKRKESFLFENIFDFNNISRNNVTSKLEGVMKFFEFLAKEKETQEIAVKFIYDKLGKSKLVNKKDELLLPLYRLKDDVELIFNYISQGKILKNNFHNLHILLKEVNFNEEQKEAIIDYYLTPEFFNKIKLDNQINFYNIVQSQVENKDKYENIFQERLKDKIDLNKKNKLQYEIIQQQVCNVHIEVKSLTLYNTNLSLSTANDILTKFKLSEQNQERLKIDNYIISENNGFDFSQKSFNLLFFGKQLNNKLIETLITTYIIKYVDELVEKKQAYAVSNISQKFQEELFNEVYAQYLEETINEDKPLNTEKTKNKKKI